MDTLAFLFLAFAPLCADMYAHREGGRISLRAAAGWSSLYIFCALLFAGVLALDSPERASLFLSGYAIEKSLSVDNLMVFSAVFAYFGIADTSQYRVLRWGIVGSAVLRLAFVATGMVMLFAFGRLLEIFFGAFVLFTATKMYSGDGEISDIDHSARWYIRLTKKFLPVAADVTDRFFVFPRVTPMFLCLVAIEFTDIAFAFDSVPAVIAVTKEPLLVYASIMFAVMGLRSLYFVLEALKRYLRYLQPSVVCVLAFVGVKLLAHGFFGIELSASVSATIVIGILFIGAVASLLAREKASV